MSKYRLSEESGLLFFWDDKDLSSSEHLESDFEVRVSHILSSIRGFYNLEVGSGPGRWSQIYKGQEYIGVDLDRRSAVYAHSKYGCDVIVGDARHLPFRDKVFDSVFSLGTVEHFPETSISISEQVRVSKGRVLISVPNLISPFILPSLVRSMKRRDNGASYQQYFGTRFTARSFRSILLSCGCEIIFSTTLGISLPPRFQKLLSPLNRPFGNELFFIIRKHA